MQKAEFISIEAGKDMIVSFAIAPSAHKSLTLLRTPSYEFILPAEERGVSVAFGPTGEQRDLLTAVKWKTSSVEIETMFSHYEIDITSVNPKEVIYAKKLLSKMIKGTGVIIEELAN